MPLDPDARTFPQTLGERTEVNVKSGTDINTARWGRLGLGERILLAFVGLITAVALLYSLSVTRAIEFTEENLMGRVMNEVLDRAEESILRAATPRLPASFALYGENWTGPVPLPAPPKLLAGVKPGFSELVEAPAVFILKRPSQHGTLLLTLDQAAFEEEEERLNAFATVSVLIVFLLAAAAGGLLARAVILPVKRLAHAVEEQAGAAEYRPLSVPVSNDELGDLARMCDRAMKELHGALSREKAFTGDVSHELRTPLTVIRTSAELMALGPLTEKQRTHLARIEDASASMEALIALFLKLARNEAAREGGSDAHASGNRAAAPSEVLERLEEIWIPRAKARGIELRFPEAGTLSEAIDSRLAPALDLETVLGNLVKNALLYTESGVVSVEAEGSRLLVVDTGPGVDEAEAEAIFSAFRRGEAGGRRPDQGSGLGLSIARRLAERNGWTLECVPRARIAERAPGLAKRWAAEGLRPGALFSLDLEPAVPQKRRDERR